MDVGTRLSVFAELAIQRTDIFFPDNTGGTAIVQNGGLGDTIAGFKYALLTDDIQYLTFQFKTYIPTGDSHRGLGTHHTSLEPGLLYLRRLNCRTYFQGEFRYWIPVDGTDYAGNIIRYGAGLGYDIWNSNGSSPLNPYVANGWRVTAVGEFVGWSVLNGKFTATQRSRLRHPRNAGSRRLYGRQRQAGLPLHAQPGIALRRSRHRNDRRPLVQRLIPG